MIASSDRTLQIDLYNYALGVIEGATGDVIVMHEAGPGGSAECNCATEAIVTRNAATKKTTYEIKLPAAALGLTPPLTVGTKFGLGMAINDGDNGPGQAGQKGWGGLGAHAIVFGSVMIINEHVMNMSAMERPTCSWSVNRWWGGETSS